MKTNHYTATPVTAGVLCILLILVISACSPSTSVATFPAPTTPSPASITPLATSPTTLPSTSTPPVSTLLPQLTASLIPSATRALSTITPTLPKPTSTRAPSFTPIPTNPFISKTVKLPSSAAQLISFDGSSLWVAIGSTIHKIDPSTGKSQQATKFGCQVCFGACDTYATARYEQTFWALQYGGIGEQNCSANDPWSSVGFMLRRIKAGSSTGEYIHISSIMETSAAPDFTRIAASEDKVWIADGNVIYVVDVAKSKPDKVEVVRNILPGIAVEGLLYTGDTLWAGGEVLIAINPSTHQVGGIYPLEGELLTFDGKRIWAVSKLHLWLQSMDIKTRELSDPILLPQDDMPTAVGFSGKAIWVSFMTTNQVAIIPVE